ncbi:MAG: hypothetical protein AMXMBFR12_02870 [Candidatus Babeliales bacterium]
MQSIFAALALHVSIKTYNDSPLKPEKKSSQEQVLTLFEEEEKKRETKSDVKLRARL